MPALDNPKHERFAQELAMGKSQAEAYAAAGYAPSEPNASRLTRNDKVAARVSEIQERAAMRAEVSVATLTEKLLAIAARAEGKDEAPMLSVARASYMDIAKLNGLAPDKVHLAGAVATADSADKAGMEELGRWAREALGGGGQEPG